MKETYWDRIHTRDCASQSLGPSATARGVRFGLLHAWKEALLFS